MVSSSLTFRNISQDDISTERHEDRILLILVKFNASPKPNFTHYAF